MFSSHSSLLSPHGVDAKFCSEVAIALRSGHDVPDSTFDLCLPAGLRAASARHWTPLDVAKRVSEWIRQLRIRTVVDVGSGAGKFCVSSALLCSAQFLGIEHRARLVAASRSLAEGFGVGRQVAFEWGVVGCRPMPKVDAYYFYNPFGENLRAGDGQIDDEIQLSRDRYEHDVEWVRQFLHGVPVGTYVITYNGYGALLPSSFCDVRVDRQRGNALRVSKKVSLE